MSAGFRSEIEARLFGEAVGETRGKRVSLGTCLFASRLMIVTMATIYAFTFPPSLTIVYYGSVPRSTACMLCHVFGWFKAMV